MQGYGNDLKRRDIIYQLSFLVCKFGGIYPINIVKVKDPSKEYTGKASHTALLNVNLTIIEENLLGLWTFLVVEEQRY